MMFTVALLGWLLAHVAGQELTAQDLYDAAREQVSDSHLAVVRTANEFYDAFSNTNVLVISLAANVKLRSADWVVRFLF